jgi:DNA-binding transcriptional LysR family regulator
LSVSAAYVGKRINVLETTLGTRLLHRSTRRVAITEVGERVYTWAEKILDDVDRLVEDLSTTRRIPGGKLRIPSRFGFGRRFVAPALARFSERYPDTLRFASITVSAAILTIRRTVELDVRMLTGALTPSRKGPTATLLPASVLSRL